ncbi:hypothetical protein [Streptomyces virginiae]|uniref:hypothetical protein n=1 Tax=Streptomyces virginiae TaxID=1961 RepID=UPI00363791C6
MVSKSWGIAPHAHKAQELLDASEKQAKGRLGVELLIASAHVEALLVPRQRLSRAGMTVLNTSSIN